MMKHLLMTAAAAAIAVSASATVVTVWEGNQPFDGWGATVGIDKAAFENAAVGDKVITNLTVDLTLNSAEYAQIIYKNGASWANLPGEEGVEQFPQPGDTQSVYTITEETLPIIKENGLRIQGLNFVATSMQIEYAAEFNPNLVFEGQATLNWWPGLEMGRDIFATAKAGDKMLVDYQLNYEEASVAEPYYAFDFEDGLGDAEIVGGGEIVDAGGVYGKVFQNAAGGMRQNYLKLPADVFAKLKDKDAFSISVFLNAKNAADYGWCPLFTAYDHNVAGTGCPEFACQYRGQLQVNCNGNDNVGDAWCDYGDDLCDQGKVTLRHWDTDWLADKEWHHYAAVFTKTRAFVYMDGELVNSWTLDGESRGQRCEFFGDERFDLFCLGGMQAWSWADPDPAFMFDDVKLYDVALSEGDVNTIIKQKQGEKVYATPQFRVAFNWQNTILPAMTAQEGFSVDLIEVPMDAETGTYTFELGEEDLALLKASQADLGWDNSLRITGQALDITKVEYAPAENAVEAVETETTGDDAWYNLQGIRVSNPTHGIYIHNGKKYVIK